MWKLKLEQGLSDAEATIHRLQGHLMDLNLEDAWLHGWDKQGEFKEPYPMNGLKIHIELR